MAYFVYIMTNKPRGTLYVGLTNDIARRSWEHREGVVAGFTRSYRLKRLVHVETYDQVAEAQQRERRLKHWNRAWKIALIEKDNPNWDDLYSVLV